MATKSVHRPSSPASVALDFDLPAEVLASAPAEVRDLRTAYTKAEAALQVALDEVTTAAEVQADNASAIRSAVLAGKKVPPTVSEVEAETIASLSTSKVNEAVRTAYAAATAFEDALIAHRPAIREALAPAFHEADEEAQEARRVAAEKDARRAMILAAFTTLDTASALADDTASGERTYRHRNALTAARSGAEDAGVVTTDYLESEDYRTAREGQAHYETVLQARAELQAIRSGDRLFPNMAARGQAEAALLARLQGLGVRA